MTLDQFTEFMACAAAINIVLFVVTALVIMVMGGVIARIHAGMFGVAAEDVRRTYYGYLAIYKILVVVFFLVPYLALRLGVG